MSGAGKPAVAEQLAKRFGWPFANGVALQPAVNIANMHTGIPLTDAARQPWLERLVYLRGGRDPIAAHPRGRNRRFMPASLARGQIDALEEPDSGEDPPTIDVEPPAGQIAQEIIRLLIASVKIDESVTPA